MSNMATNRTVASCMVNGSTNIPLRRCSSTSGTSPATFPCPRNGPLSPTAKTPQLLEREIERLKARTEETEQKRRNLLIQNEMNIRKYLELEKLCNDLQTKNEQLEIELFEKDENLTKLTSVSKNLFKEYDMLKNKYETETGAMYMALSDATNWYRENQLLRRRTLVVDADLVDEGVDAGDNGSPDHDLENLRESVKELSNQVARLQSELNDAKLLEFETSEQNATLTQEIEIEKKNVEDLEIKAKELEADNEQLLRVSKMLQEQLEELSLSEETHRENASRLRKEANDFKRERNVLAHRSTMLMQSINSDEEGLIEKLILENDTLKRSMEDDRNRYQMEIITLQEKIEDQYTNRDTEILEEHIKLLKSELDYKQKRIEELEEKLKEIKIPPPPPSPPPLPSIPPPPPPPPMDLTPPAAPIRLKRLKNNNGQEPTEDISTDFVGTIKKPPTSVNDEIINEIKCGKFVLRKCKNEGKKERETPKVVNEMLNILSSLRKTTSKSKIAANPKANAAV